MSQSVNRPDLRQLRIQAKELLRAVRAGDPAAVARVVPYFASSPSFTLVNAQLVIARENGHESWARLAAELEPAKETKSLRDQFFDLLEAGDEGRTVQLIKDHPEVAGMWRRGEYGWVSPLHRAAGLGKLATVRQLVEAGAEIYAVNQSGYPPVSDAVDGRHTEVAEYLMQASAASDHGHPPTYGCGIDMVLATRMGMLDRVRMHVERDPFAVYRRGCIGESVLHWPAHNGYVEIVRFLLDHGAQIEADEIGLYGGKPLHWASEHAPACVALLLERGANPNSRNLMPGEFEGFTPLHMMASQRNQCIECAELLLAAGADPTLRDAKGATALDVAKERGRDQTAAFLANLRR
ncbi:ankyrin repeat domain-containing protein [Fimbriimonas ginsengisoli]|uniref:Ankyrin n=1 Tax=Fimbriimonas ginsengisoli Gsoil 348 TaxID=661478 RepID=A0A068NRT6_FIMGI|nr:ankyrin repeat domain-containing protein [Fimbriimonas ginsengisoli]AIE86141.1 Ankyrin [Fimbriimonas ginsengisoli Gsoil 348]